MRGKSHEMDRQPMFLGGAHNAYLPSFRQAQAIRQGRRGDEVWQDGMIPYGFGWSISLMPPIEPSSDDASYGI